MAIQTDLATTEAPVLHTVDNKLKQLYYSFAFVGNLALTPAVETIFISVSLRILNSLLLKFPHSISAYDQDGGAQFQVG